MAAVYGGKQPGALGLDQVAADRMADAVPIASDIIVEVSIGDWTHAEVGLTDGAPDGLGLMVNHSGGVERVGLAAKGTQLGASSFGCFRFGKGLTAQLESLITAEDIRLGVAVCDLAGLHFGQRVGDVAGGGALGSQGRADGFLVDPGGLGGDGNARCLQEVQADGGGGGEYERHGRLLWLRKRLWTDVLCSGGAASG